MLTAYDYSTAMVLMKGIDMAPGGDSLGNDLGYENTLAVTMMIWFTIPKRWLGRKEHGGGDMPSVVPHSIPESVRNADG